MSLLENRFNKRLNQLLNLFLFLKLFAILERRGNNCEKNFCFLILSIIILSTVHGVAHSGGTDSYGGHKDNKNKSGLGYYHYHCGGNPPHLHKNGVCPYSGGVSSYKITSTLKPITFTPVAAPKNIFSTPVVTQKTITSKRVATSNAMIPMFSVKINGTEINRVMTEYPILSYNYITYIQLTSDILTYLDILYDWDNPKGIILNRTSQGANKGAFVSMFNNGISIKGKSKPISIVDKALIINGKTVDNSQYPVINYAGVNYLPLTTDVINNLGLKSYWSEYEGFSLYN